MSNRRTTTKSASTKKRPRRHVLIICGTLIFFGIALLIAGQSSIFPRPDAAPSGSNQRPAGTRTTAANRIEQKAATAIETPVSQVMLIDDDGQTLWASPTDGSQLDVAYLPPGVQIIAVIRPQAIVQNPEGQKVLAAFGPTGTRAIEALEQMAQVPCADMERLVVAWQMSSEGKWLVSLVIDLPQSLSIQPWSKLDGAKEMEYEGRAYVEANNRAYYLPSEKNGKVLVVSPASAIKDIIDLAGDPPPLRRDVERLLAHTDGDRDVTVVVTPNSLFSEGRSMFEGEMTRLRQPLFWFLGDELSAAALSLDWGDNFFFELIATPTLDTRPEHAASILTERVHEIPDKLEAYVVGLDPQPYGRLVVARFPAMVRKLSTYTRSGFDSDHVVLRGYLPTVAGHNLLMGAELTLAEVPGGARMVAGFDKLSPAEATSPSEGRRGEGAASVQKKLKRATTLRFVRDTLEAALEQLSQDIGVAIVIRGPDLQADGITKNQSFGIDVANKPAEEVLVEILRLANPDKTATAPNDVKQKLVYVVGPGEGGAEQIFVTTRTAAGTRGDELPAAFRLNP